MSAQADPNSLPDLQREIELFLSSLAHPIVTENGAELFDLTAAKWKLKVEFGKLLFEAWNDARSIARRIEGIAFRDRGRMGIFVRSPGLRQTGTLEFRELAGRGEMATGRAAGRVRFRSSFVAVLQREYPGWRLERVSNRSDRERSFSTCYTRGLAWQGRTGWAFLGLDEAESVGAADAVLAQGLIWLDWLRSQSLHGTIAGLKLFLPPAAVQLSAHRVSCLNRRAAQIEILEWKTGEARPRALDLSDFGNVETRLAHRRQGELLLEEHRPLLAQWTGEWLDAFDLVVSPDGHATSLRVRGLELARIEGQISPRIYFGPTGNFVELAEGNREEFRRLLSDAAAIRAARTPDASHGLFRLQSERWLESLLLRDITKVDPELRAEFVYPQVPAFAATDRGVIDILSVTRRGRLAVIELKLEEEINLPLQGLDYWLRVKWLADRQQFQDRGYFRGITLSSELPLLYLVCPAFRFHSTTGRITRYFDPAIEIIQVGINEQWREAIHVLFRRHLREEK